LLLWLTTCLLRELLREHANQILPHPITISVKPGHLVLQKGYSTLSIGTLIVILLSGSMGSPNGYTSQETIRKWSRELEDS
jgi:hypothetical protein